MSQGNTLPLRPPRAYGFCASAGGLSQGQGGIVSATRTGVGAYSLQLSANHNNTLAVFLQIYETVACSAVWAFNTGANIDVFTFNAAGVATDKSFYFFVH